MRKRVRVAMTARPNRTLMDAWRRHMLAVQFVEFFWLFFRGDTGREAVGSVCMYVCMYVCMVASTYVAVRLLTINAVWGIRPAWRIASWLLPPPGESAICWLIVTACLPVCGRCECCSFFSFQAARRVLISFPFPSRFDTDYERKRRLLALNEWYEKRRRMNQT